MGELISDVELTDDRHCTLTNELVNPGECPTDENKRDVMSLGLELVHDFRPSEERHGHVGYNHVGAQGKGLTKKGLSVGRGADHVKLGG